MDDNEFDVAVIGTSLAESIVAAALAKAGLRVLHIDESSNYGGRDASLSTIELHHFILNPSRDTTNLSVPIPVSEELLRDSRYYAISLTPSIVPSTGSLVDSLVASGVARYVPFKLLDAVGLFDAGFEAGTVEEQVRLVPSSKEDVFKNKDIGLVQKRKLMKFLMSTATSNIDQPTHALNPDDQGGVSIGQHLTSKAVGLDNTTAQAIAYALGLSQSSNEPAQTALRRLKKYILSTGRHGNSPFIVGHFGGAGELAQGFCRAAAVAGATYILGRPYTIEQLAESQNDTSIGEPPSSSPQNTFKISIEGIDDALKAKLLVSTANALPLSFFPNDSISPITGIDSIYLARCVAILDAPIHFKRQKSQETHAEGDSASNEEFSEPADAENITSDYANAGDQVLDVDCAVLVFPPGSLATSDQSNVVTAFIAGPSAMACPDGKRIVYISTEIDSQASAEKVLQPYLSVIQTLNKPKEEPNRVCSSLFYTLRLPRPSPSPSNDDSEKGTKIEGFVRLYPPIYHIAESGDENVEEATRVFWETISALGLDGRNTEKHDESDPPFDSSSRGEAGEHDFLTTMWPPLANEDTGARDEW